MLVMMVRRTLSHCWCESKLVQPLWTSVWWLLSELGVDLPQDPCILLLVYIPGELSFLPQRHLLNHPLSCSFHKGQELETA